VSADGSRPRSAP